MLGTPPFPVLELENEVCGKELPLVTLSCQEPGGGEGTEEVAREIFPPALRSEDTKVSTEKHQSC